MSTISGLLLIIFQSVWIAKSLRIVAPFASVIGSGWYLHYFIVIIMFTSRKFSLSALADGLSLESE